MSSLTDLYISDSYTGLLHGGGAPLSVSGKSLIYDGSGQTTALSLGVSGQGATISGNLSASSLTIGSLVYPTAPSTVGSVVIQQTSTTLGFATELPSTLLPSVITAGDYTPIKTITVTAQGIVTDIEEWDEDSITSTTYDTTPTAIGGTHTITDSEEWITITLPSFYNNAKGGIFFFQPTNDNVISDNNLTYNFIVSPDQTAEYRIVSVVGAASSSSIIQAASSQFQCPIGTSGGSRVIYFKREGTASATNDFQFKLYSIARQQ